MNIKGNLPLLIMQVLSSSPMHGYQIARQIKSSSAGVLEVAEGSLYPTLHDLEKRGLIEAFEQTINGRRRRCYRLTRAGHHKLAHQTGEWKQYSQAVNMLLGETS